MKPRPGVASRHLNSLAGSSTANDPHTRLNSASVTEPCGSLRKASFHAASMLPCCRTTECRKLATMAYATGSMSWREMLLFVAAPYRCHRDFISPWKPRVRRAAQNSAKDSLPRPSGSMHLRHACASDPHRRTQRPSKPSPTAAAASARLSWEARARSTWWATGWDCRSWKLCARRLLVLACSGSPAPPAASARKSPRMNAWYDLVSKSLRVMNLWLRLGCMRRKRPAASPV
mmetsp:Transcript_65470/g.184366  ORF Transcript_65470/g.184366 Transcript_65470/m.184366 type:complete len:232 (-) Transcript_65470:233-928(-)